MDRYTKYHRILNVSEEATLDEIKRATKELLKKYHPDRNANHRQWAETQTKRILQSYQILVKDKENQPTIIQKGVSYKPPAKVVYRETQLSFIETQIPDQTQNNKLFINVEIIEKVVSHQSVSWIKPYVVAHVESSPFFFINPYIVSKHEPFNQECKVVLFKKEDRQGKNLAYCFYKGGRLCHFYKSALDDTGAELCGQLEMKGIGNSFYISEEDIRSYQELF